MNGFIKWFLLIGFGIMFMGFEFVVYLILGFVAMFLLVGLFPNWFKGL